MTLKSRVLVNIPLTTKKFYLSAEKLLKALPQFKDILKTIPHYKASCLLHKISVYSKEYVDEDILKELDMAFVSVGQKYGFVSAGDVFRKRIAEAEAKAEANGETKGHADAISVMQDMGLPPEKLPRPRQGLTPSRNSPKSSNIIKY